MTAPPLPQEAELRTELAGLIEELKRTRLELPDVRRISTWNLPATFQASTACALVLQSVTETLSKFNGRSDIDASSNSAIVAALTLGYEIKDHLDIVYAALNRFCR